jgi:hypothetical protein
MPDFDSGNEMARDSGGLSLVSSGRVEEGRFRARARHDPKAGRRVAPLCDAFAGREKFDQSRSAQAGYDFGKCVFAK